jgi:hypothetical protein
MVISTVVLTIALSCPPPAEKPKQECVPTERYVEAAKSAARMSGAVEAKVSAETNIKAKRADERHTCVVILWRLPKKPGGYRIVTLTTDGRVVSVKRGM